MAILVAPDSVQWRFNTAGTRIDAGFDDMRYLEALALLPGSTVRPDRSVGACNSLREKHYRSEASLDYFMFIQHQPKWKAILTVGTLVTVALWSVVLLREGISFALLWDSLTRLGLLSLVVWGMWVGFTRIAWKWPILRWGGLLVTTPNLNGRWEGTYTSSYDGVERQMALEIRQNLLGLHCVAFSHDNTGEGILARLLSDESENNFKLVHYYHANRLPPAATAGDNHRGLAELRFIVADPPRLEGSYVNDREPNPRKGNMKLIWTSDQLKGCL